MNLKKLGWVLVGTWMLGSGLAWAIDETMEFSELLALRETQREMWAADQEQQAEQMGQAEDVAQAQMARPPWTAPAAVHAVPLAREHSHLARQAQVLAVFGLVVALLALINKRRSQSAVAPG